MQFLFKERMNVTFQQTINLETDLKCFYPLYESETDPNLLENHLRNRIT